MYINNKKGNLNFVAEFDILDFSAFYKKKTDIKKNKLIKNNEFALKLENIITDDENDFLIKELKKNKWQEVGADGILKNYDSGNYIGSYRQSCYEEELADILWNRIKNKIPKLRSFTKYAETDWDNHFLWRPIGINPLFRFIKYKNGGSLVAHYDAPFIENDYKRSLMTLVIYLNNIKKDQGGETRFIKDEQKNKFFIDRDFSDWNRIAEEKEVISVSNPTKNSAIIFDHRILHDSNILKEEDKIIIRTDIMFEKV